MCLGGIYWAHLSRLYFAGTKIDAAKARFDDAFIYEELPLDIKQRQLPTETMMHEEELAPFKAWMKSTDKTEY